MDAARLVDFMSANQAWTPVIAALLGLAETLAFLSALVPSTLLLGAVGAASATGAFPFVPVWIGASIGAIIGSTISYGVGRYFGPRMLTLRPLCDYPAQVTRTRNLFVRWGAVALIAGHFIGPLRPVAFLFAGMSGMPVPTFLVFNTIGAVAWAYAIPQLGEFGGEIFGWIWAQFRA